MSRGEGKFFEQQSIQLERGTEVYKRWALLKVWMKGNLWYTVRDPMNFFTLNVYKPVL